VDVGDDPPDLRDVLGPVGRLGSSLQHLQPQRDGPQVVAQVVRGDDEQLLGGDHTPNGDAASTNDSPNQPPADPRSLIELTASHAVRLVKTPGACRPLAHRVAASEPRSATNPPPPRGARQQQVVRARLATFAAHEQPEAPTMVPLRSRRRAAAVDPPEPINAPAPSLR
jgi:hypothetical protein